MRNNKLLAWAALGALLISCGSVSSIGETEDGLSQSGSGEGADGDDVGSGSNGETPPGSDSDGNSGEEGEGSNGGDGTEPDPDPDPGSCPESCVTIAVCNPCEDGSCAEPKVQCNADGSCGGVDWQCPVPPEQVTPPANECEEKMCGEVCNECPEGAQCLVPPGTCDDNGVCVQGEEVACDPGPPDEEYAPCEGKVCGDTCDACPPGVTCVSGAGFCNAVGSCLPQEPSCEAPTCPATCVVPAVCNPCEGGDNECSTPFVQCNDDGSCGEIDWVCNPMCKQASECPESKAPCKLCKDGSQACPEATCKSGTCGVEFAICPEDAAYEPCAGKQEGDACTLCAPGDKDCSETQEIKSCQAGVCKADGTFSK